jgi:Transcriptional regulator
MQALTMFESAARLASFTAAARELGSTQPAVSQRVVQLEEALGAPLFERGHRGVTLTEDGVRLFEAVRNALDTIRLATTEIRARRTPQTLTLSTDFGFATYWLMPRLSQFKALMPDVDVKIITSQSVFDPSHDQADIAIAFGDEMRTGPREGRSSYFRAGHAGVQSGFSRGASAIAHAVGPVELAAAAS